MSLQSLDSYLTVLAAPSTVTKVKEALEGLNSIINTIRRTDITELQTQNGEDNLTLIAKTLNQQVKIALAKSATLKEPFKHLQPVLDSIKSLSHMTISHKSIFHGSVSHICSAVVKVLQTFLHLLPAQVDSYSILNRILQVPEYIYHIKPATIDSLLQLYLKLLTDSPTLSSAKRNAEIFHLLIVNRPTISLNSGNIKTTEPLLRHVESIITALKSIITRSSPDAITSVMLALNHHIIHFLGNYSFITLVPLSQLNEFLIPLISRNKPSSLRTPILQFFVLQLRLFVSPDGTFDSGMRAEENQKDPSIGSHLIFKENEILVAAMQMVGSSASLSEAASDPSARYCVADHDFVLYELISLIIIKKFQQRSNGTNADNTKRLKMHDDAPSFIHSQIFAPVDTLLKRSNTSIEGDRNFHQVLGWTQMMYSFVLRFSWTLDFAWKQKLITDLLVFLEKVRSIVELEYWILRLLMALATTPTKNSGEESESDNSPPSSLPSQLRKNSNTTHNSCGLMEDWNKVWFSLIPKMSHYKAPVMQAALDLLCAMISFKLVSDSTCVSSQSSLWENFAFKEFYTWSIFPFITRVATNYSIINLPTKAHGPSIPQPSNDQPLKDYRERFLSLLDTGLSQLYSANPQVSISWPSPLPPPQIVEFLSSIIGIHSLESKDVSQNASEYFNSIHYGTCFAVSSAIEQQFKDLSSLASARSLLPELDIYSPPSRYDDNKRHMQDNSETFIRESFRLQLSSTIAERMSSKTSDLLKESSESVVHGDNSMHLDPQKLITTMQKLLFHASIMAGLWKDFTASNLLIPPTVSRELENSLGKVTSFVESTLQLLETQAGSSVYASSSLFCADLTSFCSIAPHSSITKKLYTHILNYFELITSHLEKLTATTGRITASSQSSHPSTQQDPSQQMELSNDTTFEDSNQMEIDDPADTNSQSWIMSASNLTCPRYPPWKSNRSSSTRKNPSSRFHHVFEAVHAISSILPFLIEKLDLLHKASNLLCNSLNHLVRNSQINLDQIMHIVVTLSDNFTILPPEHQSVLISVLEHVALSAQLKSNRHTFSQFTYCLSTLTSYTLNKSIVTLSPSSLSSPPPGLKESESSSSLSTSTSALAQSKTPLYSLQSCVSIICGPIRSAIWSNVPLDWTCRICVPQLLEVAISLNSAMIESTLWNTIIQMAIQFLSDGDVRVRSQSTGAIGKLFKVVASVSPLEMFNLIYTEQINGLLGSQSLLENTSSALKVIAIICTTSLHTTPAILNLLHELCSTSPHLRILIPRLLSKIAMDCGFSSSIQFLEFHLASIADRWNGSFLRFPGFLYGLPNLNEFFAKHGETVLKGMLLPKISHNSITPISVSIISDIIKYIQSGDKSKVPTQIWESVRPYVTAIVFLLQSTNEHSLKIYSKSLQSFVQLHISSLSQSKSRTKSYISDVAGICKSIFQIVSINYSPLLPIDQFATLSSKITPNEDTPPETLTKWAICFAEEHVLASLQAIASFYNINEVSTLFEANSCHLLAEIMDYIDEMHFCSRNFQIQHMSICFVFVISSCLAGILTSNNLASSIILQSLFRYLSQCTDPLLRNYIYWLILAIFQQIASSNKIPPWLTSDEIIFNLFVTMSISLLESKSDSHMAKQAAELLLKIYAASGKPSEALAAFGRLPDVHPVLHKLNEIVESSDKFKSLKWPYVHGVIELNPASPFPKTMAAMDYLLQGIKKDKLEISKCLATSDSSSHSYQNYLLFMKCVWKLLSLVTHSALASNTEFQSKAAEAIGHFGTLDVHYGTTIQQQFAKTFHQSPAEPSFSLESLPNLPFVSAKVSILKELYNIQIFANWEVYIVVRDTLRKLLSMDSPERYLTSRVENIELFRCWRQPFQSSSPLTSQPSTSIDTSLPWNPVGLTYAQWITGLTSKLCNFSVDPFIQSCCDVCAVEPSFAEKMLPLLMFIFLYMDSNDPERHKKEGSNFHEFIYLTAIEESSNISPNKKAFRDLIQAIVAIQSAVLNYKMQSSNFTSSLPSIGRKYPDASLYFAIISKHSLLPSTSIMFLEDWCEEQYQGELKWPDDSIQPDTQQGKILLSKAKLLASEVFSDLDDPDCAYSISKFYTSYRDPAVLSRTYLQEKKWRDGMMLFEALQSRKSHPQPDLSLIHYNMLLSLQNSGLHHILQYYSLGIEAEHPGQNPFLQEFQFQTAWRTSQWDISLQNNFMNNLSSNKIHNSITSSSTLGNSTLNNHSRPSNNFDAINSQGYEFNKNAFLCMRAFFERDSTSSVINLINQARVGVLKSELVFVTAETTKRIMPNLAALQFFTDIQTALEIRQAKPPEVVQVTPSSRQSLFSNMDSSSHSELISKQRSELEWNESILNLSELWNKNMCVWKNHCADRFELVEPLLVSRGKLLSSFTSSPQVKDILSKYWIQASTIARKCRSMQMASVALEEARNPLDDFAHHQSSTLDSPVRRVFSQSQSGDGGKQENLRDKMAKLRLDLDIEECKVQWSQMRQHEAVALSMYHCDRLSRNGEMSPGLAKLLRMSGEWLAATKLKSTEEIGEQYLQKSSDMYRNLKSDDDERCKAHFALAKFADFQYLSGLETISTPEWKDRKAMAQRIRKDIESSASGEKRNLEKSYKQELESVDRQQEHLDAMLNMAISNYFTSLLKGAKYDIQSIFRMITLWFDNQTVPKIVSMIKGNIHKVKSYKFLPVWYQIAARISAVPSPFQTYLHQMILKVIKDHPYHSLYQLIALSNGDRHKRVSSQLDHDDKAKAAAAIITKARIDIPDIVDGICQLSEAYIELASVEFHKNQASVGTIPMPSKQIARFKHPKVAVATATLNPKYSTPQDIVYVDHFKKECKFVGGVNLPRKIECVGSDGNSYVQLVKGRDDMRQDAVMQQLFHAINNLLQADPETSRRKLTMRTYNAIPLSPQTGVLEWVQNTQPLAEYLIGNGNQAAHVRYRPSDWHHSKCRHEMEAVVAAADDPTLDPSKRTEIRNRALLEAFEKIMRNIKPVLHHFFLENYLDPAIWLERRLVYTRSVAASSMIGYIVGLGDRHSYNILLDKLTGELIHIDLGVAFDQGMSLSIPEVVPFRLTRDMIDGMGIAGVRGVFERCCQHVMRVLRDNHDNLLTIVQVFLHDPLSKWLSAPVVAAQPSIISSTTSKNAENIHTPAIDAAAPELQQQRVVFNTKAKATFLRFKQKLIGQELGTSLSVEGQVQRLITEAQDIKKLAVMFYGWGAWL